MHKAFKFASITAALAISAGVALATTPAKADVRLNFGFGVPLYYSTPYYYTPYYYAPRTYYYAPTCYWDSYYGRVCY